MKKIFAIALALMLVMSMSVTAFAETTENITNVPTDYKVDVNVREVTDAKEIVKISVDVTYGEMQFSYVSEADTKEWNPLTHDYDKAVAAGAWQVDNGSNFVTVTNHSNVGVTATFTAPEIPTAAGTDLKAEFDVTTEDLTSAAEGTAFQNYKNADYVTAELTLSGDPEDDYLGTAYKVLGQITVGLAQTATDTNP